MNYAQRKIGLKKSFSAIALVLLFYLVIALVVGLMGARAWSYAKDFVNYLSSQLNNLPQLIKDLELRIYEQVAWLPDSIELRFNAWLGNFVNSLLAGENAQGDSAGVLSSLMSRINLEWFKAPMSGVLAMAGRIPVMALTVAITVISTFFMTNSYDSIVNFIKRQLKPEHRKGLSATKRILFSSMKNLGKSYLLIMFVTFFEWLLGLLVLRWAGVFESNYWVLVAAVIAVVDILPVVGSGTIVWPWAFYHLIMGHYGLGAGLLVIWAAESVVRQFIEPKLVASNLGLPPVATLAGMYIGLQLFGIIGMFIVPILLILVKLLNDEGVLHIWKPVAVEQKEAEVKKRGKALDWNKWFGWMKKK